MALTRQNAESLFTVTNVHAATAVADATPVLSAAIDLTTLPNKRHVLVMDAFETNAANTGGTWSVTESATSGGEYKAATTSGSLAATGETAGNVQRVVSIIPNPAKPFIKVTFTGADENTEVTISANLFSFGVV